MGQRMVHFSEYSGRVEEIDLPGGRSIGAWSERRHRRRRVGGAGSKEGGLPTSACALSRWVTGRKRGGGIRGGMEEGVELGGEEHPYGVLPRGLRRGVRRHPACSRNCGGAGQAAATRQGADLYAAITHDEPGLGQTYALREREAAVEIEIRW